LTMTGDDRRERTEASAGDGGGGGSAGREISSKPAVVGRVPLYRLFAFADRTDAVLMAVGAVAAVANGMAQPLMTFIFGDVIDAFGSSASPDDVLHRVVKVRCHLNS
jgi:ATP-binding cassette, subfamily B (MDR/TAP), member 1